ncbi:methyl farnesoate epoxidase-like isoform X2 [Neocloeon triangulifer]|uniref:methyl farnesoate epoxidase-like isoform X2 n=1 Tax=Neocloeon triangulifer TaxID=2078957 RepID=UPI00286ED883|nr:methyl farnesoate epoxidase-like isoform X2 [Neocloeon triangulifer]
MLVELVLIPFLAIIAHILYKECRRPKNFPPGPKWVLPVFGNLYLVYSLKQKLGYLFLALESLAEKYGPVYGLKLGQDVTVVITDYEIMKSVLTREEFQGRPNGYVFTMRTFGEKLGIAFGDGPTCMAMRNFTMKCLRDVGAGKETMNWYITEEASEFVKMLKLSCGETNETSKTIKLDELFKLTILNSQWLLIAGKRFDYDDKEFIHLLDLVTGFLKNFDGAGGLVNRLPWIRFVAPELSGFNKLNDAIKPLQDFLWKIISDHKENFNCNAEHNNYVDLFLAEIFKQKEPSKIFNEKQLVSCLIDLLMAGMITTSDAMVDMLHFAAQNQELQKELQAEIDRVIGRNVAPTMDSYNEMVWMRAFNLETLRFATIGPISVARRATKDTTLMQYRIPKDTVIVPVLHQALMDERYWKDPHVFRPERFLNADKTEFIPDERVNIAFGLAR